MKKRILFYTLCFLCIEYGRAQSRNKRENVGKCEITPSKISFESPIESGKDISISCTYESEPQICLWYHNEPNNEEKRRGTTDYDTFCSSNPGVNSQFCSSDKRIRFIHTNNKCGITIRNSKAEDTGKWFLNSASHEGTHFNTFDTEFILFTYNSSKPLIQSVTNEIEESEEVAFLSTTYNYNERDDRWLTGKSRWETIHLRGRATGGRPTPSFKWYINNNQEFNLENEKVFVINEGFDNEKQNDYIKTLESEISFDINTSLLEYLSSLGIETNPQNGKINFILNVVLEQKFSRTDETKSIGIEIERPYLTQGLRTESIGMIVGILVSLLLIIIIILVVVFAKRNHLYCFSNDEYGYTQTMTNSKKKTKKLHPEILRNEREEMTQSPNNDTWLRTKKERDSGHSTNSSRRSTKGHKKSSSSTPPPRPPKSNSLNYADLDLNASTFDPKNRVLPSGCIGALPPKHPPTTYSTLSSTKIV